jgi:hypothetical protein
MDEDALFREKLDPALYQKMKDEVDEVLSVIVQTQDGLKDEDKKLMGTLGGKIKDNLYIINAYSAEIPSNVIKSLILSPRIVKIYSDAEVRAV